MTIAFYIIAMTSAAQITGTFTDSRDDKTYKTVKIGTQTWMAENLAHEASSGFWKRGNEYVYNWETAKTVCPSGWHLPTDAEWTTLIRYLGGESVAGGKLKETDTTHWQSPNTGATNETGFTAIPSGYRLSSGSFYQTKEFGDWWTSTEHSTTKAYNRTMRYDSSNVYRYDNTKNCGFSVRCLQDN